MGQACGLDIDFSGSLPGRAANRCRCEEVAKPTSVIEVEVAEFVSCVEMALDEAVAVAAIKSVELLANGGA